MILVVNVSLDSCIYRLFDNSMLNLITLTWNEREHEPDEKPPHKDKFDLTPEEYKERQVYNRKHWPLVMAMFEDMTLWAPISELSDANIKQTFVFNEDIPDA